MNTTKGLLTLLLCSVWVSILLAQPKVQDKSGKKPGWATNMVEPQYVITAGEGNSISEAQQQAITLVKQEIVRAVAESIVVSTTMVTSEKDNEIQSSFRQEMVAKANKVPAVQGISASSIEEFYWEKLHDKSTKRTWYRYYVKYPFSKAKMAKLVEAFRTEDQKMTVRIDELEKGLSHIESVEQLDAAVEELRVLKEELDDKRSDRATMLISRYRNLYSNISIVDEGSQLGNIQYSLRLNGNTISTSRKPNVRSECATIVNITIGGTIHSVRYLYEGCYEDLNNFVELSYRLGNSLVTQKFPINLKEGKLEVRVVGPVSLHRADKGFAAVIPINATSPSTFEVESVELRFYNGPATTGTATQTLFSGKGMHNVNCTFPNLTINNIPSQQGLLNGSVSLINKSNGERISLPISNVKYQVML